MRIKRRNWLAAWILPLALQASAAFAQIDLNGYWYPIFHEDWLERIPGPEAGDYLGLPVNDAQRLRADTWHPDLLTVPEHQCKPHPSTYGSRGVGQLRMWEERDPHTQQLIRIRTHIQWQEQERDIWMDGRQPPPEYAAHTWQGFSVGQWEGDVLVVRTTHLKAGWIRRNGLALSDRATLIDRFYRHGDTITHVMIVSDPVYLTEPLVKTNGYRRVANGTMGPYPCRPAIEIVREPGVVPHYQMGENTSSAEFAARHHLPVQAVRGGAHTALPEFTETLKKLMPPAGSSSASAQ
jgi:hypothetical protein